MIALYRTMTVLLSPLIDLTFFIRLLRGKEDWPRVKERLGKASLPRPSGRLVWFHGASVGELQSLLPLVTTLLDGDKTLHVLVTTGTRTSAALAAKRLPSRAIHQYVPLDYYPSVRMFFEHWRPDLSVFTESEFWPELLWQAPYPLLLNARMSDRSYRRYKLARWWIKPLLARFITCLAQTDEDTRRLRDLGAPNVHTNGNLKYDAAPLPADAVLLAQAHKAMDGRPVLVGASTHPGEDEVLAAVHQALAERVPGLLTLIAPRHPHRGVQIVEVLKKRGLVVRRRALQELPDPKTDIYVADTIGEMGLWYRLATSVVMGGSFVPHGGQNPLECLKLGKHPVCGPHMENFRDMTALLTREGALTQVADVTTLADVLLPLLTDPAHRQQAEQAGGGVLKTLEGASGRAAGVIRAALQTDGGHA
jgi:3-deoxy-D-manno-octulosonic-acid transferase